MQKKKTSVDPPNLDESNRPRVIICGECNDAKFVYRKLDNLFRKLDKKNPIVCLQGRRSGLDKIVNQWAFGAGYLRKIFYPDRERHKRDDAEGMAILEMTNYAANRLPSFVIVFAYDDRVEAATALTKLNVRRIEVA